MSLFREINIVISFFMELWLFSPRFHCYMTNHVMEAKELNSGGTRAVFWQSKASRTRKNSVH